ncbi:TPA: MFS transporter [Providencia rettgeri]
MSQENLRNLPLLRVRSALFISFLMLGFIMASWIVRTPSIRDILDASTGKMGIILFGFSLGSMSGIVLAGRLIIQLGADIVILIGMMLAFVGLIVLSNGTYFTFTSITGIGLFIIGFGVALADVAVNVLGAHLERRLEKPVLTLIHGCFSLGTMLGAIFGLIILAYNFSVTWHMLIVCSFLVPMIAYIFNRIKGAPGSRAANSDSNNSFFSTIKEDNKLILIGLIVLSVALAEGAANDWLPLLIVDTHETSEAIGSLLFVTFAATMTLGRFLGTQVLKHYGPVIVLQGTALIGAIGIIIVIIAPNVYLAGVGVLLWGIGASLGFPVAISAGAENGQEPTARIAVLATIGYMAFLVGPPILGFIGEHIGIRLTMLVVLVLLTLPILLAPIVIQTSRSK